MSDHSIVSPPAIVPPISNPSSNHVQAGGTWYYDHKATSDPPEMYAQLLGMAINMVCIWDPYIDEYGFPVLAFVPDGVEVQCLTSMGYDGSKNFNDTRVGRFLMAIDEQRNRWISRMTVRYYNSKHDDCGKNAFHDRYLFVDDHVYVVGNSLAHHAMRNGSTAIHRIESSPARDLIRSMYSRYWTHRWTEQVYPIGGVHYAI